MRKRIVAVSGAALLLVLLIAAWIVYQLSGNVYYSHDTAAEADPYALTTQLKIYKDLNGFYPTTAQGLEALVSRPKSAPIPEHWIQQFKQLPKDPWGILTCIVSTVLNIPIRLIYFPLALMASRATMISECHTKSPNQSMKSTVPLRSDLSVFATDPARGLSPSR